MKVIINVISINQRTNNIFSEEEIDIKLLKYSSYRILTLKRLALEGEVISEIYEEMYDFSHLNIISIVTAPSLYFLILA